MPHFKCKTGHCDPDDLTSEFCVLRSAPPVTDVTEHNKFTTNRKCIMWDPHQKGKQLP